MPCDICSTSPANHIIPAPAMCRAARKGFNPFHLGMVPPRLARLASPDFPSIWRFQAISGELSKSDWRLCDTCHPKLRPFLAVPRWLTTAKGILNRLFPRWHRTISAEPHA